MENGNAKDIKPVEVTCEADRFENIIREFGVIFCCEWFGHRSDSEFVAETIQILIERSNGRRD